MNGTRTLLAIGSVLALAVAGSTGARQAKSPAHAFIVDSGWIPTAVGHGPHGDVLAFRNGRRLRLDLYSPALLGQLPRAGRAPLLIIGAWGCTDCDIEAQVYVIPADAQRYEFGERGAYYYPGTLTPAGGDTDTLPYYRGRMFVGKCLTKGPPAVVWFESERDSTGTWHANVYRLIAAVDSGVGAFLQPMPSLASTLHAVKAGACFEVPGMGQSQY